MLDTEFLVLIASINCYLNRGLPHMLLLLLLNRATCAWTDSVLQGLGYLWGILASIFGMVFHWATRTLDSFILRKKFAMVGFLLHLWLVQWVLLISRFIEEALRCSLIQTALIAHVLHAWVMALVFLFLLGDSHWWLSSVQLIILTIHVSLHYLTLVSSTNICSPRRTLPWWQPIWSSIWNALRGIVVLIVCLIIVSWIIIDNELGILVSFSAHLLYVLFCPLVVADLWVGLIWILNHRNHLATIIDLVAWIFHFVNTIRLSVVHVVIILLLVDLDYLGLLDHSCVWGWIEASL